jgi:hypothetical protein
MLDCFVVFAGYEPQKNTHTHTPTPYNRQLSSLGLGFGGECYFHLFLWWPPVMRGSDSGDSAQFNTQKDMDDGLIIPPWST